jgi:hypothetical protein
VPVRRPRSPSACLRRTSHNALDGDGDGLVTEAELRAAAEYRGIQLTDEQVAAFLAADADGDGVDVEEYINSLDWTVRGNWLDTLKGGLESGISKGGERPIIAPTGG